MKGFRRVGEGVLLGGILAVMIIAAMIIIKSMQPVSITVTPVHLIDIVITQPPKININTADLETLTTLSGIGEVIAQRIIDRRTERGPIGNIDELLEVDGIGEAKLDGIRDQICIN